MRERKETGKRGQGKLQAKVRTDGEQRWGKRRRGDRQQERKGKKKHKGLHVGMSAQEGKGECKKEFK